MRSQKKSMQRSALAVLLIPALLLAWGQGRAFAVRLGAGLAVPEAAVQLFLDERTPHPDDDADAEIPAAVPSEVPTAPAPTAPVVSKALTTPKAADAPEAATQSVGAKAKDLTATPPDIAALAAKAQANAKAPKLGAVISADYAKSGATNTYDSVRVKNTTETKSVDIKKELKKKVDIKVQDKSKPAVLLFHTHTTEAFALFERDYYTTEETGRSNDPAQNMVRVGDEIAAQLTAAGYTVIHDTTIHDTSYNGAYGRSAVTVAKHLKEHPEIQIVLDIHRDAMRGASTRTKPVTTIQGKKAAQIMLVTGAQEGKITDFANWQGNLTFAVHLQKTLADRFPGLARPIFFCQRKYNMNQGKNNLLIEIGTDSNTLDEVAYSGRLLGVALAEMF
ncbi:MAG: stage II sporulation protein P [Oscillospiraceae bacterium]|jgi:stage II sporulation protein P|nr:stage II sporulation protein P [Oscillospiraceae bacterium]